VLQEAGATATDGGLGDFVSRTPIPFHVFLDRWYQVGAGRWHRPDDITLGETRTAVIWGPVTSRIPRWRHTTFMCVGDNMGANGCLTGGRSPEPPLNRQCYKKASIEALYDRRFLYPWSPSALQPGDWGTRDGLEATIAATAAGIVLPLFPGCSVIILWFSSFGGHSRELEERCQLQVKKCSVRFVRAENSGNNSYALLAAGGRARLSHVVDGGRVKIAFGVVALLGDGWWSPDPDTQTWRPFDLMSWLVRTLLCNHQAEGWVCVYSCSNPSSTLAAGEGLPMKISTGLKVLDVFKSVTKTVTADTRVRSRAHRLLNSAVSHAGFSFDSMSPPPQLFTPGDLVGNSRSAGVLRAPVERAR
jgi:hypothetical protein